MEQTRQLMSKKYNELNEELASSLEEKMTDKFTELTKETRLNEPQNLVTNWNGHADKIETSLPVNY